MATIYRILAILVVALALVACGGNGEEEKVSPSHTPTLTATLTPEPPTSTPTAVPTDTATPTASATATSVPATPTPTREPTPTDTPEAEDRSLSFDNMLTLDGASYVEIPNFEGLVSSQFTLEAWVKLSDFQRWAGIIVKGTGAASYSLQMEEDGRTLRLQENVPSGNIYVSRFTLEANTWYHVAATYDGSKLRFYVGAEVQIFPGALALDPIPNEDPLIIGADLPGGQEYFVGQIGEVRIWNYARSRREILRDMAVRLTGAEDGLVGYWPLDDTADGTAADLVAGHNGTLVRR